MIAVKMPSGRILHRYQNAKDMPAGRFHAFQKYIIEEWATGGTIQAVDAKFGIIGQLIADKSTEKALRELNNIRMGFNYMLNEVNIKSYAFACTVAGIDDVKFEDYSESALKEIIKSVEREISQTEIEEVVGDLKKKSKIN